MGRSNGNEPLVPIGDIEFRSGHSEQRALAFLQHDKRRIHEWWDGTPAVSWKDARWVVDAMTDADERQRLEDVRRGEQLLAQLEAEQAERQRRAAEQQGRSRVLPNVPVSKPGRPQPWDVDE
jgi:hypothetical protein